MLVLGQFLFSLLQSMIELSRTQDEEVGDGTTSVIVLGMLLSSNFHNEILLTIISYI